MAPANCTLFKHPIRGLLIDISGVLYIGSSHGDGVAIQGSNEAIERLRKANIPFRLCSNETQNTRQSLVDKLNRLGFSLSVKEVFTPAPAVANILKQRNLNPYLLIHPKQLQEFDGICTENPNCVVVGDAAHEFTYDKLNAAFRILMSNPNPVLITMGLGKFYQETEGLMLDLGGYTKALEYACDVKAELVGKPDSSFFKAVLNDMQLAEENVVMIGDDIIGDVGGAQACGMRGVQVRTGKWRDEWENHPHVVPDAIVENLSEAVCIILNQTKSA